MRRRASYFLGVVLLSAVAVYAQRVEKEGKAWLDRNTEPAEINVNGIWQSDDWGEVTLNQAQGSREVTGTGDNWDINGVVSGKMVFLLFSRKGRVSYSVELAVEGENTLKGSYAKSIMTPRSKTRPMLLTSHQQPVLKNAGRNPADVNGCKYLLIPDFTSDPYGIAPQLRAQGRARGLVVISQFSEVPSGEQYKACWLRATWSSADFSGQVSAQVVDLVSNSVLAETSAGGTAWWSVDRTVRAVVAKIYDQMHLTGYREDAYLAKIKRLYPPRPKIPMSEADVRAKGVRGGIEGIWVDPDNTYRLGIVGAPDSPAAEYQAFILSSNIPAWEPGEIKAEFRSTASPTVFTCSYYMANKSRVGTTFVLERDVILRASVNIDGKPEDLTLMRVWPSVAAGAPGSSFGTASSSGTGFVVTRTGLVATNWHVVRTSKEIEVGFPELATGNQRAEVVLRDVTNDLAILRLSNPSAIEAACGNLPFEVAPSSRVTLGQKVQTIGYPLEPLLGTNAKFSEGVVASRTGWEDDPRSFQISTQVQPGSSGSPLFDAEGNVIGVVVATLDAAWLYQAAGALPQNVNWAIKSEYLINLLSMLPGEALARRSTPFTPEKAARCVALIRTK